MDTDQIEKEKKKIDMLTHYEMATLYRFLPPGHPYFDKKLPLNKYFMNRFRDFGGMSPEISKSLGWGE